MSQRIKVVIRPKPLPKNQIKNFLHIDYLNHTIALHKPNEKIQNLINKDSNTRSFAFTQILQYQASQQEVYQECAFSIVENTLQGYNGTIFAYGQTGSGKTYTIMGSKEYMERKTDKKQHKLSTQEFQQIETDSYLNELKGIIPRAFNQIITVTKSQQEKKHLITCSFMEIYNENVHDLLGEDIKVNLHLKENAVKGLVIDGLTSTLVKTVEELQKQFKIGYKNRSVRQTTMNKESSRSHCIFSIKIEEESTDEHGNTKFKVGKLNLVDLAGSQRQNKTESKEAGIKEASKINLSLSALGKVINCLSNYRPNQKIYIPYRDSKLTRILQDSLGGNTKTMMIATITANSANYQQTLSTLIYASRARFIQNTPVLNQDPKDVLLREYMQQIKKLKQLLLQKQLQNQGLKEHSLKAQETQQESLPLQESLLIQNIEKEEAAIKQKIESLQNIMKKDSIQNEDERKQLKKIQELKKKIRIQEEKEAELERQKKQREEELFTIQKDYRTLNEEVDVLRSKFKELKQSYLLKCEELEDYRQESEEEKTQYHLIIKQKDKQIKKLQQLLATVLEENTYQEIVDEGEEELSEQSSNYSTRKLFNNLKVEHKAKIKLNSVNLFTQEDSKHQKTVKYQNQFLPKKQKIVREPSRQIERKKERSSYSSLKEISKAQDRREKIKKVDSMISLKPKGQSTLPFITEVKKMNSRYSQNTDKKTNLFGLDVGKIKSQILSELKGPRNRNY